MESWSEALSSLIQRLQKFSRKHCLILGKNMIERLSYAIEILPVCCLILRKNIIEWLSYAIGIIPVCYLPMT